MVYIFLESTHLDREKLYQGYTRRYDSGPHVLVALCCTSPRPLSILSTIRPPWMSVLYNTHVNPLRMVKMVFEWRRGKSAHLSYTFFASWLYQSRYLAKLQCIKTIHLSLFLSEYISLSLASISFVHFHLSLGSPLAFFYFQYSQADRIVTVFVFTLDTRD